MAHVVAFVPDLLFGSNVLGALQAAGHDPLLVARADELQGALAGADVLIVDLTDEAPGRIKAARAAVTALAARGAEAPRTLAFFSHVDTHVRTAAEGAGFDLVVPRSRMARATADLVAELTG